MTVWKAANGVRRSRSAKFKNRRGQIERDYRHYYTFVKNKPVSALVEEPILEAATEELSDLEFIFDASDLVENPSTRLPICLCLDVSGSMAGEAIEELNKGVEVFYEALKEDEVALYAADVSIITFDSKATLVQEFSSIAGSEAPPAFEAGGKTYMGEAVNIALDALESRKAEYQENGVDYYQPWLVLMTDGTPNGQLEELSKASDRTAKMIENRKLTVFPIGIGSRADLKSLEKFSPSRSPLRLQGFKFKEFFSWLSQSVAATSQSIPGESIPMDIKGLKGWADLSL